MRSNTALLSIVCLLVAWPTGYDVVRAYWLPIELNRAMGGHYALPIVSSRRDMNRGLRAKKQDWRKRGIRFTYTLRRVGEKTHLRGQAVVETRFLRYAGIADITVSMDRDLIVPDVEIPDFKARKFEFEIPDLGIKVPNFSPRKW